MPRGGRILFHRAAAGAGGMPGGHRMDDTEKSLLRARVRSAVRALTAGERAALSRQACAALRAEPVWKSARRILFYAPLGDEVDIGPLLDEAWAGGRAVALLRFETAIQSYTPCAVASRAALVSGPFGVLEPGPDCPAVPLNPLDLVFVPGVAFDLGGRRLGRGKGFYDRVLAAVSGHKCGVAFDAQLVATVPEEPHDVRVNSILTPAGWRTCAPAD